MTRLLEADPLPGYPPEIGRWLWAMEELRRRTLRLVEGLEPRVLDWQGPEDDENAIGSLLYHIALVEMSWLFLDLEERGFPEEVRAYFPHPMDTDGRLTPVPGVALADHLARLERSRRVFLDAFRTMTVADWDRRRAPKDTGYEVTPAWAVFHLVEHEAGHAAQISSLRKRAERILGV